ncbi:hypothetical protein TRVL_01014 [Trypanosoma vivax]|nr:hypothetical protein TRVL_01014 [Trypanosoma vivax]
MSIPDRQAISPTSCWSVSARTRRHGWALVSGTATRVSVHSLSLVSIDQCMKEAVTLPQNARAFYQPSYSVAPITSMDSSIRSDFYCCRHIPRFKPAVGSISPPSYHMTQQAQRKSRDDDSNTKECGAAGEGES